MATPALHGKTIVIIGGTTGMGLAGSRACVEAGANVVALGNDPQTTRAAGEALGPLVRTLTADAADSSAAPAAIELAVREFGGLDGLYHVAGGSARGAGDGPLHELSDGGWDHACTLNLSSMIWSNRAAVRQFLRQKSGGSILNMGSTASFAPSPKYFATHGYAAAKAGAIGLTTSAAAYYAPHNVRFNCVAPGLVQTPMSLRAQGDGKIMAFIRKKQPLDGGRIGRPEDLDAAVVFFLSDGSRFVTGQVLAVDSGWSVSEGQCHD